MTAVPEDFVEGLEGVVAFTTEIAEPDKDGGALRYRGAPPSLSGSAIWVVKATTPSSPSTKSSGTAVMGRFSHPGCRLCLPVGNKVADVRSMNQTQNTRSVALSRGNT